MELTPGLALHEGRDRAGIVIGVPGTQETATKNPRGGWEVRADEAGLITC